jgi:hypothetical protein
MDDQSIVLTISLAMLGLALAVVSARAIAKFVATRSLPQAAWGAGLALASAAMFVETIVYLGFITVPLLQAYVFLSAAIVGVLSLGATRVLRNPRFEVAYAALILVGCTLVGIASFVTPLSLSMVSNGVIAGNPPLVLLLLSSVVTGPATVVLLASAAISLKRSWRWQTMLMVAGALVLGAGGTLYIASFPIALYYSEFIGIGLLFLGLMSLPASNAVPARVGRPAASQ